MFAIIDIETCSGKFVYGHGRITEICIIKHDGLAVIEKFTTLINPECNISQYFSSLTGITNDMVRDAPKFYEVAKKIQEMILAAKQENPARSINGIIRLLKLNKILFMAKKLERDFSINDFKTHC